MKLKFRIWDDIWSQMLYSDEELLLVNADGNKMDFSEVEIKNLEVMMATGIIDKQGKMIFEKDILKNTRNNKVYRVVWNGSHASFEFVNCEDRYQSMLSANRSYGSYEVIGNIYENRELWEGKNEFR